jgi:hypothetical protein
MTTEQKTPGVAPKATGTKLSREEMARRDERCLKLFIAGHSEREIGRLIGLTGQRVHQILRREIARGARHRELLRDEAVTTYISRCDVLLRAVWPKAMAGDLKAVETARHVIEQQAKVVMGPAALPTIPATNELDEFDPNDEDDVNELERYRRQRSRRRSDY